ncbi:MAG: FAD-binding oxidoreductase [Treponema sp.]|jgi:sarcosine oxidase subunit beta|nr:FAD-binding oxidoreductase [Treponema sp.]
MPDTQDVLIVGGGIIGASCAYHLARRGLSVTVLEKNDTLGDGGSSRNGGGVRQSGRDRREMPLAMYAVEHLWPSLSDELGVDVEYCQKGNLRLGKTEAHRRILEALTEAGARQGLGVSMISGEEARDINPWLSRDVFCASWCPTDGHANPLAATLGFYKRARELGARFISGEKALRIEKLKGAARRVAAAGGVYEAPVIIVAAGLGSRPLAQSVGLDVPMQPVLLEALVTETAPDMFPQMLGTAMADFYGHQAANGSFVFGLKSGYEPYAVYTEDKTEARSSSASASAACRSIEGYFPALANIKVLRAWAGWMDDCADHVPVLSFVDEVPGLILACGFSGHGFGISPCVGKLLAELAAGEAPCRDISAFRYDRFVVQ